MAPQGVTLQIHYTAAEAVLNRDVFNQDGNFYLKNRGPCRYAYLAQPMLYEQDGRLMIKLLFKGQWGVRLGDRCMGPVDSLYFTVTGTPQYDQSLGRIGLNNLDLVMKSNFFSNIIRDYVNNQLPDNISYALAKTIDALLAEENARSDRAFDLEVLNFDVLDIRIAELYLELQPTFTLIAK